MSNPFEEFFSDPVYLEYKNHLFNYLARCRAIRTVVGENSGRSLEIGSGISPVTDASVYTDLSQAAMRKLARGGVVTDATQLSFQPGSFDSVVCSEVLEHIPDDRKVLSEIASVLKPGGKLVLTVPMHPHYWAFDDRYVGHQRRYRISELIEKVESAGFTVVQKKKVGGPIERLSTWLTVKLFLALSRRFVGAGLVPAQGRPQGSPLQKFLPVYKALNQFLASLVRFDAWLAPESLASIILLECRKK